MKTRAYGQYCGFARALEVVGERWALLVVRDLLVGPKRFTDLLRGLPGIPSNVLTARLKELEHARLVRRRVLARPSRAVVYELTAYGLELEPVVAELGRWGAKNLGDPRPDETITVDSLITALRTTFTPAAARRFRAGFELRVGEIVLHARVDNGRVAVAQGALPGADLAIEAGPGIRALMAGELSPAAAIENGTVRLTGNPELLTRFAEIFRIEPMPAT
ncbi:MAG: helix-turn-helix transcriptional regulator [Candidatus Eremiobacteraeota bacterium]|nr:helix-turn-helix transcriptional regulator [Candidatus Eremiobacteraeota bacterium]